MGKLVIRRFLAFTIDYLLIMVYAFLLFAITVTISPPELSPILGQAVGFVTLTLPVFLYFYLTEKSKKQATVGKRLLKILVDKNKENDNRKILIRNIVKFLPWEIAHFGVHWMRYYVKLEVDIPIWVWISLLLPQVVMIIYVISIFAYKGKYSLYDKLANTKIEISGSIYKKGRN